jgi:DNA-binding NtrC family response regulator
MTAPYLLIFEDESTRRLDLRPGATLLVARRDDRVLVTPDAAGEALARLTWRGGVLEVVPVREVLLNDQALATTTELVSGDVLGVGKTRLVLHGPRWKHAPRRLRRDELRDRLAEEVERALRYRRSLSVLVVRLGPGDDLDATAARLTEIVRDVDIVGVTGPAEIAVLLPETGSAVTVPAERILAASSSEARCGLASLPGDAGSAEALLAGARAAAAAAPPATLRRAGESDVFEAGDVRVHALDPKMLHLVRLARRLAAADRPVLVLGETGSGKELVARALHAWSGRAAGKLVSVDCAALGESLLEGELFGHERGSFTGAQVSRPGLLEQAHGGTLFLDAIGDAPLRLQAELVRVLETGRVRRIGADHERSVDVRLVVASDRMLDAEVDAGRFRGDLLERLEAKLVVPPLRERTLDVPLLARGFLERACARHGRQAPIVANDAMERLLAHEWPGNVRELRNVCERLAVTVREPLLQAADLPEHVGRRGMPRPGRALTPSRGVPRFRPLHEELADLERTRIAEALHVAGGVRARAAALIGMPLRTFASKLRAYGLDATAEPRPQLVASRA